jgi:hypothetical protein
MFKSLAQKKKLAKMVEEGKLSKTIFDEWEKATAGQTLPERAAVNSKKKHNPAITRAKRASKA